MMTTGFTTPGYFFRSYLIMSYSSIPMEVSTIKRTHKHPFKKVHPGRLMEPDKTPLVEENHLPNISKPSFSGSMLIFGGVLLKDFHISEPRLKIRSRCLKENPSYQERGDIFLKQTCQRRGFQSLIVQHVKHLTDS